MLSHENSELANPPKEIKNILDERGEENEPRV